MPEKKPMKITDHPEAKAKLDEVLEHRNEVVKNAVELTDRLINDKGGTVSEEEANTYGHLLTELLSIIKERDMMAANLGLMTPGMDMTDFLDAAVVTERAPDLVMKVAKENFKLIAEEKAKKEANSNDGPVAKDDDFDFFGDMTEALGEA